MNIRVDKQRSEFLCLTEIISMCAGEMYTDGSRDADEAGHCTSVRWQQTLLTSAELVHVALLREIQTLPCRLQQ